MNNLIIFASGTGTNADAIIQFFKGRTDVVVSEIISNKADAGVLAIAEREAIPATVIDRKTFESEVFCAQLMEKSPQLIILAGFLWKMPHSLVTNFSDRIINIHPALLPQFGGKGMYGSRVHEAVLASGAEESGITIHYVNEEYDKGNIIAQAYCSVSKTDDVPALAQKIHALEHFFYPRVIEFLIH